jgi:hypothetical protein
MGNVIHVMDSPKGSRSMVKTRASAGPKWVSSRLEILFLRNHAACRQANANAGFPSHGCHFSCGAETVPGLPLWQLRLTALPFPVVRGKKKTRCT